MKPNNAGVDRSHAPSHTQKRGFALLHFIGAAASLGIAFGLDLPDRPRAILLAFIAALYFCRHLVTLFYLLVRKVEWAEVIGLSVFMIAFEIGFVLLGGGAFGGQMVPFGGLDVLALALVLLGSFLNTYSEMQRKWWKADPANKGHCYTLGLFRHAMHINFFGDVVLFTGWALLTANLWTLALPLAMGLSFAFFHIPGLDTYLAGRYGDEFSAYAARTKKLIPFVY